MRGDDGLADLLEHAVALRGFAGRDDSAVRRHAGMIERGFGRADVMTRDVFVGDDIRLGARPQRRDARAERREQAAPDDDVVAARAERDGDGRTRVFASVRTGAVMRRPLPRGGASRKPASASHDFADDRIVRHFARLHGEIGLRIDRLALGQQLAQRRRRIGGLQHRPIVLALVDPAHQHVEFGIEPDRDALGLDGGAGIGVHDGAAAGRQNLRPALQAAARSRAPRRCGNRPRRGARKCRRCSCRRPSRSRHRRRRKARRAARRGGGRSTICRPPSCRPARSNGGPSAAGSRPPKPAVGRSFCIVISVI